MLFKIYHLLFDLFQILNESRAIVLRLFLHYRKFNRSIVIYDDLFCWLIALLGLILGFWGFNVHSFYFILQFLLSSFRDSLFNQLTVVLSVIWI